MLCGKRAVVLSNKDNHQHASRVLLLHTRRTINAKRDLTHSLTRLCCFALLLLLLLLLCSCFPFSFSRNHPLLQTHSFLTQEGGSKFLIDGFPRDISQAFAFEQQIGPVHTVLHLECSRQKMLRTIMDQEDAETAEELTDKAARRYIIYIHPYIQRQTDMHAIQHSYSWCCGICLSR